MSLDVVVAFSLYVLSLTVLWYFALKLPIESDQVQEYEEYLKAVNSTYRMRDDGLITACPLLTVPPYLIVRLLQRVIPVHQIPFNTIFRLTPYLSFALWLPFTYLIARLYLPFPYAIVAVGAASGSFYFCYSPNIGRTAIGMGWLSALFFAVLVESTPLILLFMPIVMFSHYATFLYFIAITVPLVIASVWFESFDFPTVWWLSLTISLFYYGFIQTEAGKIIKQFFVYSTISVIGIPSSVKNKFGINVNSGIMEQMTSYKTNGLAKKAEVISSFSVIIVLVLGTIILPLNIPFGFLMLAAASIIIIGSSLLNPIIANMSGSVRAYAMSLPVLSVSFAFGVQYIARSIGENLALAMAILIVIIQLLAVSGLLHRMWGWDKRKRIEMDKLPIA